MNGVFEKDGIKGQRRFTETAAASALDYIKQKMAHGSPMLSGQIEKLMMRHKA